MPETPGAHGTLSAATVATETFTGRSYREVTVVNVDGADDIYFTLDGTAPTSEGDDTWVLPAAAGYTLTRAIKVQSGETLTVKLISAGTPKYAVQPA